MSTLGKVLIVLNGLAAVGFLCLAAIDYGTRQLWAYQVLRHEVALEGLPVDEADTGKPPSNIAPGQFSPQTLDAIFGSVGGNPVPTQVAEVERKRDELLDQINVLGSADKKREKLKSILMGLEQTGDQRDRIEAMNSLEQLQNEFNKKFDDVLPQGDEPRDPEERRRAIAHLLYNLSPEPAWHDRVQVVVGLQAYGREAEREAADLEKMAQRAREMTTDERIAFEREYKQTVQRRTLELAQQSAALEDALQQRTAIRDKHKEEIAAAQKKIEELKARVQKAQEATVAALEKQKEREKEVFDAQRELIDDFDKNLDLEKEIRRLELGR
jgi:hypothetical protein